MAVQNAHGTLHGSRQRPARAPRVLCLPITRQMALPLAVCAARVHSCLRGDFDMTARTIRLLGVVGAGQMGAGIAQVAAAGGLTTCLIDKSQEQLHRARDTICSSLSRLASKGKLVEHPDAIVQRLSSATELEVSTCSKRMSAPPPRAARERRQAGCDLSTRTDRAGASRSGFRHRGRSSSLRRGRRPRLRSSCRRAHQVLPFIRKHGVNWGRRELPSFAAHSKYPAAPAGGARG